MSSPPPAKRARPSSAPTAPTNTLVRPLLTDMYQLTMCYAYWKSGRHNLPSHFELFFRKAPFDGEITIVAGIDQALSFVQTFKFEEEDLSYIKTLMPQAEPTFFEYLSDLDCSSVTISAVPQGSLVFPRVPLVTVTGPLGVCQLLETTLLTLVNYPSLVTTNAVRFKIAAGPGKVLLEFGLRRAQGPDGGFSASKYCVVGGFDGTSNVIAGMILGEDVPVKGTHAHAFVQAFGSMDELEEHPLKAATIKHREEMGWMDTHDGEVRGRGPLERYELEERALVIYESTSLTFVRDVFAAKIVFISNTTDTTSHVARYACHSSRHSSAMP